MSNTSVVSIGASRRRRRQTAQAVTVSVAARRNTVARRRAAPRGASGPSRFLKAYADTLSDPWEFSPVPLGYDCFLPTSLTSAYARASFTVGTDGSFSIALMPDLTRLLTVSTGTKDVVRSGTMTIVQAANIGYFSTLFKECRIVSGGVRIMALFPQTSASGVLFAGGLPDFCHNQYDAASTQGLANLPGAHLGLGAHGASATLRPYDNSGFEFFAAPIVGVPVTSIPVMTSAFIAGLGFPANTVVWYEAIINLEAIALSAVTSGALPADDLAAPNASSYFPTVGSLWSSVQPLLPTITMMDAVDVGVAAASGGIRGAAKAAMNVGLRNSFGRGGNSLRASSNPQVGTVMRSGRESSIMIEEMKEDASGYQLVKPSSIYEPRPRGR